MYNEPPNRRSIVLPDCCCMCEHFELAAQSYPDECTKYQRSVDPNELCDEFERADEFNNK